MLTYLILFWYRLSRLKLAANIQLHNIDTSELKLKLLASVLNTRSICSGARTVSNKQRKRTLKETQLQTCVN